MKTAIVLFNLGGPDSPEAVAPFLRNLFSDPAIIALPGFLRRPLARVIAARRAGTARGIYAQLGGKSPILAETRRQKDALEAAMRERGIDAQCVIAMRCWKPFIRDAFDEIERLAPDAVLLLPLYPQYSTTTTGSSLKEWERLSSAQ
ncbi:MAG: ferrochelatase, partial [Alphaproteobacteria bacterium]|nr:ferrochelatase [Alphaproteobacteria bacterium]